MLYPVLQRMEMDGLITSKWRAAGESRPRRYYRISEAGREELASELEGWRSVWGAIVKLGADRVRP
jgi:DNA-binding PadR family transcriptional regulator